MTAALVWEDPPTPPRGTREATRCVPPNPLYVSMVAALRQYPGEWARIGQWDSRSGPNSERVRIKSGAEPAFIPVHEFEFATSGWKLYARYCGAEAAAS